MFAVTAKRFPFLLVLVGCFNGSDVHAQARGIPVEKFDNVSIVGRTTPGNPFVESTVIIGDLPKEPPISTNCINRPIQQRTFAPGAYPVMQVASPVEQQSNLIAAPDTFEFYVDMPIAAPDSRSFKLGEGGDFQGDATICRRYDPTSGMPYDEVTFSFKWNYDSGGGYVVNYSYVPFGSNTSTALNSSSGRIEQTTFVAVDGGLLGAAENLSNDDPDKNEFLVAPGWEEISKSLCLVTATKEIDMVTADLVLTPEEYASDHVVSFARGFFAGKWRYISSVLDAKREVDAVLAQTKKDRISLVMTSHGHVDRWDGFMNEIVSYLFANNANVRDLSEAIAGKVSGVTFISCCTGKGKANGKDKNVLDSIKSNIRGPGHRAVSVCGYRHAVAVYFREKKFRIGHSKAEIEICS